MDAPDNNLIALVTLSPGGLRIARILSAERKAEIFVHKDVEHEKGVLPFDRIISLTGELFKKFNNIVYICPLGVAVRAIAPYIKNKRLDPAVVAVDIRARWAVSLLSGHEGGANELAMRVANILGSEPIITTSTQADKDIIAGLGCRKGTGAADLILALNHALQKAGVSLNRVRLLASADIKKNEAGMILASRELDIPLYFVPGANIINMPLKIAESDFVLNSTGLGAVAEPCALLAGRNTKLILGKTICKSVTVALARENFF